MITGAENLEHILQQYPWREVKNGTQARTLINDTLILQKRPRQHLIRWQAILKAFKNFPEHKLFAGTKTQILEIEDNCFWTLSERVDSPNNTYLDFEKRSNIKEGWNFAEKTWKTLLDTSALLSNVSPKKLPLPLFKDDLIFLPHQHWTEDYVLEVISSGLKLPLDFKIPAEPKNEFVIYHGDSILKNLVHNREHGGYCFIDWEGLSVQRKQNPLAHWFAFLLFRTSPEEWVSKIEPYEDDACSYLGVSLVDWKHMLGWFCLREIAAWGMRGDNPNRFKDSIYDADILLAGTRNIFES